MNSNENKKMLVAVYGTLMTGESNERWAREAGAKVVATGTVRGRILDTGFGYPIIRIGGNLGRIRVDVLETDEDGVRHMDALEGYPNLYGRETVLVANDDKAAMGTLAVAFNALIYAPQNPFLFRNAVEIAPESDGVADWRAYRRGRRLMRRANKGTTHERNLDIRKDRTEDGEVCRRAGVSRRRRAAGDTRRRVVHGRRGRLVFANGVLYHPKQNKEKGEHENDRDTRK